MFTVKSSHWAYEREWRILQPLPDASKVIDASPFPIHLFPLPFDSIASIVFGARMTSQARNELSERVRRNSLLAHITLRQAVPDDAHFLLRIEKAA